MQCYLVRLITKKYIIMSDKKENSHNSENKPLEQSFDKPSPKMVAKNKVYTAAAIAGAGGVAVGAGGYYVSQLLTNDEDVVDAEVVSASAAGHSGNTSVAAGADSPEVDLSSVNFGDSLEHEDGNIVDADSVLVGDQNGYVNAVLVDSNNDGVYDSSVVIEPIYDGQTTPPPAAEPIVGLADANADTDADGYVDAVLIDSNQDGVYDSSIDLNADTDLPTDGSIVYRAPEPNEVLDIATNVSDDMSFSQAFANAREEVGPGGIFYWNDKPYGTYYENEWNAMSEDDKNDYWDAVYNTTSDNNDYTPPAPEPLDILSVSHNVSDDMSFSDAFANAREDVGPGGMFYWHGKPYGTYYENEWNSMSDDQHADYWDAVSHTTASEDNGAYTEFENPNDGAISDYHGADFNDADSNDSDPFGDDFDNNANMNDWA
jgi:hypothetical protein